MHPEAYTQMHRLLQRYGADTASVLDVGSADFNGTYRPLVEGRGWKYTGTDIQSGRNVDVVMDSPHELPFDNGEFDIVISGSTLEHVERPWLLVPEMARVLRNGGFLAIITHHRWALHEFPKDYWRFMPSGIEVLFDLTECLERYEIEMFNENDVYGLAWKSKE